MTKRTKAPTMLDVAKIAGVSPMTVSRAMKKDSYVRDETRKRILDAAEELGYVFDSTASGLSSRKTGFIAVIVPSINNANFADTVRGINDGLKGTNLQILLGYSDYQLEEEERLIAQFLSRRPEAIVTTGGTHTPRCRKMLENAGIPVIETWDLPEDPIGYVVGFSNADTAKMMVDHFVDTGRSRLAFIGGDDSNDRRGFDRRNGFIAALKARGLEDKRHADSGRPPINMRKGADAMRSLLEKWPDTDAVMCVSDLAAFGALAQCKKMGIDVPGRLAIGGFGAYDVSDVSHPAITTIDVHAREIGFLAAEVIRGLLEGDDNVEVPEISYVSPELIVRDTTLVREPV
ncbi:MAG: LacI family DNA-binding transcriptional regulator [Rhizobiaceae bacterium]